MIDWSKVQTAARRESDRISAEAEAKLLELDMKSLRALRAVATGTATQQDMDSLRANEAEAAVLRTKVKKP